MAQEQAAYAKSSLILSFSGSLGKPHDRSLLLEVLCVFTSFTVLHVCFVRCHFDLPCTCCTDSRKEAPVCTISISFAVEMESM